MPTRETAQLSTNFLKQLAPVLPLAFDDALRARKSVGLPFFSSDFLNSSAEAGRAEHSGPEVFSAFIRLAL